MYSLIQRFEAISKENPLAHEITAANNIPIEKIHDTSTSIQPLYSDVMSTSPHFIKAVSFGEDNNQHLVIKPESTRKEELNDSSSSLSTVENVSQDENPDLKNIKSMSNFKLPRILVNRLNRSTERYLAYQGGGIQIKYGYRGKNSWKPRNFSSNSQI